MFKFMMQETWQYSVCDTNKQTKSQDYLISGHDETINLSYYVL